MLSRVPARFIAQAASGARLVRDVMSAQPKLLNPTDSVRKAAQLMAEKDVGALPVGDNDRIVGMVTDRDIVVRGLARGAGNADLPVKDVMSREQVLYCYEDDRLENVAKNMAEQQVC